MNVTQKIAECSIHEVFIIFSYEYMHDQYISVYIELKNYVPGVVRSPECWRVKIDDDIYGRLCPIRTPE